jgi:hypothetical protein
MGTATSRFTAALTGCLATAAVGCGAAGKAQQAASARAPATGGASGPTTAGVFPAVRPAAAPAAWGEAKIPTGAVLSYPPGWRLTRGDTGTATAVQLDGQGRIAGYLNLTPRQSRETLADWTGFRIRHNVEEGDRDVTREAVRDDVPFRRGRGACVRDGYTTVTGARYIELACLVTGARATSVIVGAAPPREWSRIAPTLERAIGALLT